MRELPRSLRLALGLATVATVAACGTRTSYPGQPSHSAMADHELTIKSDHLVGADQSLIQPANWSQII